MLICVVFMAGCTDSLPAPVATPAPGSVAATVAGTPAPAGTAATVATAAERTTLQTAARTTVPAPVPDHPYSKTYTFEATGDYDEHTFTTDSDRTWVFRLTYPREGDFIVLLKDKQANVIEVLADGRGPATSVKSVWLKAGTYYLDVKADAPWTITMTTA